MIQEPETGDVWQCPTESRRSAAEWVAEQDKPPVDEDRKAIREQYIWADRGEVEDSALDPELVCRLAAHGMRPQARYATQAPFATDDNPTNRWERLQSDDGITNATVFLGESPLKILGFETAFEAGTLVHLPSVPTDANPQNEYEVMSDDPIADYVAHRARVRERIESGEVALSMADPADNEAYVRYYADYLSSTKLAAQAAAIRKLHKNDGGLWLWIIPVSLVLGVIAAIGGFIWLAFSGAATYYEWLLAFWPIALITSVPQAVSSYLLLAFRGHMNHLDHKFPDSMEQHAGFWIKAHIASEGLADRVEVGKAKEGGLSGLDAYLPLRNKIVLGERTYEKQDPTFWAIAAHELGHAVASNRAALLAPISLTSRVLSRRLLSWGIAVMLANTFFGWSVANTAWQVLFIAALVCNLIVLIDEAIASTIAMRILRSDDLVSSAITGDLRRHLGLAFATYFAPVIALTGVLLAADPIANYIVEAASFVPAEPLHPDRTSLGNVLSIVLVATLVALQIGRRTVWGPRAPEETDAPKGKPRSVALGCLGALVGLVTATAFFLEVWDQPLGSGFRTAVFIYAPMASFLLAPVLVPLSLLMTSPTFILKKLKLVPEPPTQGRAARAKEAANDMVAEIVVMDPRQGKPWYLDAAEPGMLFHTLPLVVMWWMSQI